MSTQQNEYGERVAPEEGTSPQRQLDTEMLQQMLGDVDGYACFQMGANAVILDWPHGAERLMGFSRTEIIDQEYSRVYTPEDAGAGVPTSDLAAAADSGLLQANRFRRRKDGSTFPASILVHPLRNEEGEVRGYAEITRDRTDAVRTERLLAESEQRYRSLFDNNPDPVFALDLEGRFLTVNAATEKVTGYARDELIGRPFMELLDPATQRSIQQESVDRARRGESVQLELTLERRGGTTAELAVSVVPLEIDNAIRGVFGIAKDITERNRLEREQRGLLDQLGTERARLAAVVRQMPAGVLIADAPTGQVVLGNTLLEQILRQPVVPGEAVDSYLLGKGFDRDGRTIELNEWPITRAIRLGETVTGEEIEYKRGDGTRAWLRVHSSPIRDPRGRIIAGVAILDDIEAEKRAAEAMRFLAEASSVLTSSLDHRKMLRRIARLAVSRFANLCLIDLVTAEGLSHRQYAAHGDPVKEKLVKSILRRDPADFRGESHPIGRVLRSAQPLLVPEVTDELLAGLGAEDEFRRLIMELGLCSLIIVPMQGRHRVLGTITFASADRSRRFGDGDLELAHELARRSTSAIENAELFEAASAASEAKSNFLAVVSHELRTPLNAIVGYCELLLMGVPDAITESAKDQVERVRRSAEHLRRVVEEILTFTRVEGGTERVSVEPVDLRTTLEQCLEPARRLAKTKGLEIRVNAPDSPWIVETDGQKLCRIVGHLINNAVKFTEEGEIEIQAGIEDGSIVLLVRDTGEGIEERFYEQIFEPFWQIDSSRTRRHEGTGLGLSVARQLARLMGGEITVASKPGRGTDFRVALPVGSA